MRQRGMIATGSTGNPTSAGLLLDGENDFVDGVFYVEAVGATPTVTFKFQGSNDGVNWTDIMYVTEASDTVSAAARTVTAVGEYHCVVEANRRWVQIRCVVSANTNVTFRATLFEGD